MDRVNDPLNLSGEVLMLLTEGAKGLGSVGTWASLFEFHFIIFVDNESGVAVGLFVLDGLDHVRRDRIGGFVEPLVVDE